MLGFNGKRTFTSIRQTVSGTFACNLTVFFAMKLAVIGLNDGCICEKKHTTLLKPHNYTLIQLLRFRI